MGKDNQFIDVGSGIGQVVIQVAATVGCAACGIEYLADRHAAAKQLLDAFVDILEAAQVEGRGHFLESVNLIHGDLQAFETKICRHSHIFFNNFGFVFDTNIDTKFASLNMIFSGYIEFMAIKTQIITLRVLPDASKRLHGQFYLANEDSATWSSAAGQLKICHYTKLEDGWTCLKCSMVNNFSQENCIICNCRLRSARLHR